MAKTFLQSFDKSLKVFSAGTDSMEIVNPFAIRVMQEIGIDISQNKTESINQYLVDEWDYVITVCGKANKVCPPFTGIVKQRWHLGFDDPSEKTGSDDEKVAAYRNIRDEIREAFYAFYSSQILGIHSCGCK